MNDKLRISLGGSPDKLTEIGFTFEDNNDPDPRGHDWNIKTSHFHLWVDPWCDVFLRRLNPDTDHITVQVEDVAELKRVIDFIQD